jgi:hypothetical protein
VEGCTTSNKQRPINVNFKFLPPLEEKLATDIMMVVEFDSVDQVRPFSLNGVQHHAMVRIATKAVPPPLVKSDDPNCKSKVPSFKAEVGPQAYGGSYGADSMNGQHVFAIMDTILPAPDGSYVKGRWLALPTKKAPGHIGTCRRHCIHCDEYPELSEAGQSTGTICVAPVSITNRMKFAYRLYLKKGTSTVLYDGAPFMGAEWEVQIHDATTGSNYPIGSILLEGTSNKSGIADISGEHKPVGCAPCDAYYHAVQTTGPFILSPRGKHELQNAVEEPPDWKTDHDRTCFSNRVISLGGFSLLYESGPGVKQAPRKNATEPLSLFNCPIGQKIEVQPRSFDV